MIEIPDPVIRVETETDTRTGSQGFYQYETRLVVGGVDVLVRNFHDDYDRYGEPEYAEDVNDAERKVLEAFGLRLKELFA